MSLKITILCENSVKLSSKLIGEHGFSCFIETENNKLLFDVGQGYGIINNSLNLNKNLSKIDGIVLSHGHWDHVNGLEKVINCTGKKKIYAHSGIFTKRYNQKNNEMIFKGMKYSAEQFNEMCEEFIKTDEFTEILQNIYVTGQVPRLTEYEKPVNTMVMVDYEGDVVTDNIYDDISVVVDTPKGLVVILGCAHSGVVNILNYVTEKLNKNIYAVIGGTHLHPVNEKRFEKTIDVFREYDIKHIGVSHCTGPEKSAMLYNEFKDRFFFANVGIVFEV